MEPAMKLLREAIAAVPAVKYALGVGGIAAVISIVLSGLGLDTKTAIVGTLILLVLMVVLVVFSRLTKLVAALYWPALVLCWAFLLLTITSAGLFAAAFFFDVPKPIKCLFTGGPCAANGQDDEKLPVALSEKFRRVEALLGRELPGEAVRLADETTRLAPSNAEAWYLLGRARYDLVRYDEALQAFDKARNLDPSEARYHHAIGSTLAQIGRHREAMPYYEEALKRNPAHGSTLYNLGYSYRELGYLDKALEYYRQTIKLGADSVPKAAFAFARIQAQKIAARGACSPDNAEVKDALWALSIMLERGGDYWARVLLGSVARRGAEQLKPLQKCGGFAAVEEMARRKAGM